MAPDSLGPQKFAEPVLDWAGFPRHLTYSTGIATEATTPCAHRVDYCMQRRV